MPDEDERYLTEKKWHEFLQNDWLHLQKVVSFIKGQIYILGILIIGLLSLMGYLIYLVTG